MNNEEKILSLLEQMAARQDRTDATLEVVKNRLENIEAEQQKTNERLTHVEGIVVRIENDHGRKLNALFDGYKQHTDMLDRIEKEVSKHEEVILRKVF